jgi:class 3 adenylate cyclase
MSLRLSREFSVSPPEFWSDLGYVEYDRRGVGFSTHDTVGYSIEEALADLDAVVSAASQEPVVLYGVATAGPLCLRYAAWRPERVSHVVLFLTWESNAGYLESARVRAERAALAIDWGVFRDALICDISRPGDVDRLRELLDEEFSSEAMTAGFDGLTSHDAGTHLASIRVPTLVISQPDATHPLTPLRSRRLVHELPNARELVDPSTDWLRFSDATIRVVREFLGTNGSAPVIEPGASRTIMFTDLVSSTALTQSLGDDGAQRLLETHDQVVRGSLSEYGGVEIKHTGDGIMAAFASAGQAVRAAETIVRELDEAGVDVRIGLNAGEPIDASGDMFGTAVQLAARVCDQASTGEILATTVVHDLTAGTGIKWESQTSFTPRGFDVPVDLFSLQ